MKQILLTLVAVFICLTKSYSQTISVKDLTTLINSNDNDAEKLLNSKAFEIYKFDSLDYCTKTSYAYKKDQFTNNADAFVAIAIFFNGKKIVSTDFGSLSHFSTQKSEAEKLGFKFVRTVMDKPKSRFQEYKKDNITLTFWTNTYTPTTQYEIAVSRD
jgi:hypothetical protein